MTPSVRSSCQALLNSILLLRWPANTFPITLRPRDASVITSQFSFAAPEDTLPDFSYAGYGAGTRAIPTDGSVVAYVGASGDASDRTADIQSALDQAAQNGGGIVLLGAGNFYLSSNSLNISTSNVILRGDSSMPSKTILHVSGDVRNVIQLGTPNAAGTAMPSKASSVINQDYVPLGATSVNVSSASDFTVGQSIILRREATKAWVETMRMSDLKFNKKHLTWIAVGTAIDQEREITAISDNVISWQVPITDPLNQTLSGDNASVIAFSPPSRLNNIGVESLTFVQFPSAAGDAIILNPLLPVSFGAVEDCWGKNLRATGFLEFAEMTAGSRRITLQDFAVVRDKPTVDAGKGALPLDIKIGGTQVLVLRGTSLGAQNTASYIVATGALVPGPNVVSGYTATNSTRHIIQPHQRWATGFLVEASNVGRISMSNRRVEGSGQGWSIGTGIVWASKAKQIVIKNPPTSRNFLVNTTSTLPSSLYQAQLIARVAQDTANTVMSNRQIRPAAASKP